MRFSVKILVFMAIFFTGVMDSWAQAKPKTVPSNNPDVISKDCELKRKTFIYMFSGKIDEDKIFHDKNNGHLYDYDDVLKNPEFKKLCTADQNKMSKIIHSTVRIFLLAEPEDPSDIKSDKDYQPIEDENNETTGTVLEQSRVMVALPHHDGFTPDPWKSTKPFRIRVVNFEGHEAVLMVTNNKIVKMGGLNEVAMLKLNKSLDSVNPYFGYNFISNFNGEIIQNYENFVVDKENMKTNPFLFYRAYEKDEDVWLKKKLRIGFGADKCFYDDNVRKTGKLHAGSSHWITAHNQGGGIYNFNFILVGIDQGVVPYPDYKKLTELFDIVPMELFK